MKCVLIIVLVLGFVVGGAIGASNEVNSVNVVGFHTLSVRAGADNVPTMAALGFNDLTDTTLLGVFGTDSLYKHTAAGKADRIYIFNPALSSYDVYYQQPDNLFYCGAVVSNPTVLAGQAFWLFPAPSQGARDIAIAGEVVIIESNLQTIVEEFQMLANPFSADVPLNDLSFVDMADSTKHDTAAGKADRIYVFDTPTAAYKVYGLRSDGWAVADAGYSTNNLTTDVIPLGQGFWYASRNVASWTWVETNKYLQNL